MRRLALLLLLAACTSNRGEIRVVERPAPAETTAPAQRRFEIVETATVETGSSIEVWVPLASEEAGVQEIERLDVTIKPVTPYEVATDSRGNRLLHLKSAQPVSVSVAYRVRRTERSPAGKKEDRPLGTRERSMLAPELEETLDGEVAALRSKGIPARRVFALRLDASGEKVRRDLEPPLEAPAIPQRSWIEVYVPGLAWVTSDSFAQERPVVISSTLLIVARGTETALPFAKVEGAETAPRLGWKTRPLDAP